MRVLALRDDRFRQLLREHNNVMYSGRVLGLVQTSSADQVLLAVEWKPNEIRHGRANPNKRFVDFHSFDETLSMSRASPETLYSAALAKGLL